MNFKSARKVVDKENSSNWCHGKSLKSKDKHLYRQKYIHLYKLKNSNKKEEKMDWLYGIGAFLLGGSSVYLFFQQVFLLSLTSFMIALFLTYLFETNN